MSVSGIEWIQLGRELFDVPEMPGQCIRQGWRCVSVWDVVEIQSVLRLDRIEKIV